MLPPILVHIRARARTHARTHAHVREMHEPTTQVPSVDEHNRAGESQRTGLQTPHQANILKKVMWLGAFL